MENVNYHDIKHLEDDTSAKNDEVTRKAMAMMNKIRTVTAAEHYRQLNLLSKFKVPKSSYETKYEQDFEIPE